MKKLLISLLVLLVLLTGCAKEPKIKGSVDRISAAELMEKIDNKETFIFYVGASYCEHCKLYREYLDADIENYPLHIYFVEADGEENEDTFDGLMDYLPDLEYPPTTYYVKDGVPNEGYVGDMDEDQINIWLKRNEINLEEGAVK